MKKRPTASLFTSRAFRTASLLGLSTLTGGTSQAVNGSASPLWAALDRAEHVPGALPFVGPQMPATPQNITVASLALGGGSTFNFNLQNTQEAAGTGYDLTTTGAGGLIQSPAAAGIMPVWRA